MSEFSFDIIYPDQSWHVPYGQLFRRISMGKTIEQAIAMGNTSKRITVAFNGKSMSIKELSLIVGLPEKTVRSRLQTGWDIEKIVSEPLHEVNSANAKLARQGK